MTVKPKLDKKALKEAVRLAQLALSAAETAERFPSQRRKCKYCGTQFNTPATYNGQQMRFCTAAHRKAFDKEGEKPIDVILRKQENRMRKIAREEASNEIQRALSLLIAHGILSPAADDLLLPQFRMPSLDKVQ